MASVPFFMPRQRALESHVLGEAKGLALRQHLPYAIGGRRMCFVHPSNPDHCVKVLRRDVNRTVRIKQSVQLIPNSWRREHDNNASEAKALLCEHQRIGARAWEHFPRCYGTVNTDLGSALELDLYRDHDGLISRTLRELLHTSQELDRLRPAFEEFSDFLLRNHVITRGLLDHNLVCQLRADESWKIYLVDGFGDRVFLPFHRLSKTLAARTIRRRLRSAWLRFEEFQHSGAPPLRMETPTMAWDQGCLLHRGQKSSRADESPFSASWRLMGHEFPVMASTSAQSSSTEVSSP